MTEISYTLWDASSNYVDINPAWGAAEDEGKIIDINRTKSGKLSMHTHGTWRRFSFQYEYVPASVAAVVNSWFDVRQLCQLKITDDLGTEVFSVQIVNLETPFGVHAAPGLDYFMGKLDLSEY
jgi:hypothetical protein